MLRRGLRLFSASHRERERGEREAYGPQWWGISPVNHAAAPAATTTTSATNTPSIADPDFLGTGAASSPDAAGMCGCTGACAAGTTGSGPATACIACGGTGVGPRGAICPCAD